MAVDGSLIFNTKIDTSGLNSDIARINKAIEAAQSKAQAGAKTTAQTAQNATQQVSNSADKIVDEVKNNTSDIGAQIQNIIADTERSAKSKAMSIASILKRTGMTQAEAMQAAWNKVNSSVSQQVKKTNSEVEQETEKTGKNIKENTDLYSKQVLDVLKSIDKNVADSSKNISEKVQKAVTLSASKAKQSLQIVRTAVDRLQSKAKMIGRTLLTAFGTAAVVSFGKESIELGSDLAEVQNVVDVTFSHMSASVDDWAKSAQKAYGLSETMAKKYVGTFGSMAEAFGFTEQQAFDMSTSLTALTGDVASFYNITQDEAYTKLKSVFSGETETLKDLGVVMTQNALDNYAMANGWGKTTSAMTEAEKVTLRYNFVLGQLSNATGDFARTQNSWANQTRILQLQFDSIKATIGQGLINAFTPLLNCINQFISRLSVAAQKFKDFTAQVFGYSTATSNATSSAVSDMSDLASQADSSTSEIEKTSEAAEDLQKNLAGFDELNVMSDTSDNSSDTSTQAPSSEIKSMQNALEQSMLDSDRRTSKTIDNIVNSLDKVKTACVTIKNSWEKVWNNGTGEKVLENINSLINTFVSTVGDIAEAFTNAWEKAGLGDSVVQSFIDKWNSLVELLNTVGDTFRQVWNDGKGEKIWSNILEIIRNCNNFTETLRTKIKDAWKKNDTGRKIWENILGIVEDITGLLDEMSADRLEWLEDLDINPVAKAVERLSEGFRNLLKACGDKLKQAYKNVLLPLAKWTIEKAVPTVVNALSEALKFLGSVIKKIPISVITGIATAIGTVVAAIKGFKVYKELKSAIENIKKSFSALRDAIKAHPYAAAFMAIATAVTAVVSAIKVYNQEKWSNSSLKNELDKTQELTDKWQTLSDEMSNKIKEINDTKLDLQVNFDTVDKLKDRLEEIIADGTIDESEQGEYKTIVDLLSEKVDGFDEHWNSLTFKKIDGNIVIHDNIDTVTKNLDELVDKWEIAQAKLTLSSMYSDLTTEKKKAEIQLKTAMNEDNTGKIKEELEDYIYQNSILSKKEAKYYTEELIKQKGDMVKTKKAILEKANNGLLDKNEYKNLIYSDNGQINMLYGGNDTMEHMQESVDEYWEASDALQELQNNVNAYTDEQDKCYGSLKAINGETKDYNAYLRLSSEYGLEHDTVLSLLKDDGITTWEELEAAARSSSETVQEDIPQASDSVVDSQEKTQGALNDTNTAFSDLDDNITQTSFTSQNSANTFSKNTNRISGSAQTMADRISNALTAIKTVFSNVFEPLYNIIKKPLNNVLTGLESFINGFISALNGMLSGVDTVANAIGKLFGQEWHAGQLDEVHIPKLATGAYVPANYGEFLAVLGDNKREPEVVSPISAMKQAMAEVLAEYSGMGNGGDIHITLTMPDGRVLFEAVADENNKIKKRTGRSAFA
jgi:hypothetical protein